jgi:chromosome partitioning protein
MKRLVFTNDKGGVGKTTTVANLAVGLSQRGKKVLVVDMDPQADVTFALLGQRAPEAGEGHVPPTTHALLIGHYPVEDVILDVPRYRSLFVIPSNADLADAATKLSHRPTRLLHLLKNLPEEKFDVVLIDTGKGLDPLAINALTAAQSVIAMVSPGRLELDAIERVGENVRLVREEILLGADNPTIKGILLTLADPYTITRDTLARLRDRYPRLLLDTVIPKNNDLQKAIGRARSIFEVAPESKGAKAYQQLLGELSL